MRKLKLLNVPWHIHGSPSDRRQGNCLVGICFLQKMCYQSILPFCWRGPEFSTWIFHLEVLHKRWSFSIETLGGAFLNANRNWHLRPFKLRNNLWCARVSLGKPTVIAFGLWRRRSFIPWTPKNDREWNPTNWNDGEGIDLFFCFSLAFFQQLYIWYFYDICCLLSIRT